MEASIFKNNPDMIRSMQEQFTDPIVERFTFDYHAPPSPFTFEQLNRDYRSMLSAFDD